MLIKPWQITNQKMSGVSWRDIDEKKDIVLGSIGFIYEIVAIEGHFKGHRYIGKKNLFSTTTRKIPKKEQALQLTGRKKLKERVTKESNWRYYCGSNKILMQLFKENPQHFERRILFFCDTAKRLTYHEAKILFKQEVLERNDYWNTNILSKFFQGKDGIV